MRTILMIFVMAASGWFFRWGIPWLLKRYPQPVWRYASSVPAETLHRHHRFAAICVYACFLCIVGMVSSIIQVVALGWRGLSIWFLVAYLVGASVSAVPAIVLGAWMGEVERECRLRGIPTPSTDGLLSHVKADAMALLFWIAVAIMLPWIGGAVTKM